MNSFAHYCDSRSLLSVLALTSLGMSALPAQAQIIDDFSGTTAADSANYNTFQAYAQGYQDFSISGGQLDPTLSPSSTTGYGTTAFIRNTGQFLSDVTFGESVSIDAVNVNNEALAGLRFSTSDTSLVNDFEVGILGLAAGPASASLVSGNVFYGGTIANALTLNFTTGGSVTETFTRVSDTTFDFTFAGPGLASPVSGSFTYAAAAGHYVYFGPDFYEDGNGGAQIEDNLAFTVPEPSTYAMMLAGLLVLGFCVRRKTVGSAR